MQNPGLKCYWMDLSTLTGEEVRSFPTTWWCHWTMSEFLRDLYSRFIHNTGSLLVIRAVPNWLTVNQLSGHTHTHRQNEDFSGTAVNKSPINIHAKQHTHLAQWIDWFMRASQHVLVTVAAMWVWECWQLYVNLVTHEQLHIMEASESTFCDCLWVRVHRYFTILVIYICGKYHYWCQLAVCMRAADFSQWSLENACRCHEK